MGNNSWKDVFLIDPEIVFLNFGSFGACPKPVFKAYQNWQLLLEKEPVQFIAIKGTEYLKESRTALAGYVNCDADDLVYVTNPSYGLNIVARSLDLKPGDEILTTDLEYGASDIAWEYYCKKAGARYVRQAIPLPIQSKEEFVSHFFKGLSAKTKLIFISHITSSTGLLLPVEEICEKAHQKGIITFVDGAHAPGLVPLNLTTLKADIYSGACHKWMMAPKGSSFLYIKKEHQDKVDPLLISWGYNSAAPSHSKFLDYHQMQGTRDFSAFLTVPQSIAFMNQHNWTEVARSCRQMVLNNAPRYLELLQTKALSTLSEDFITQMFSFQVRTNSPEALQKLLFETYKIEIPVMRHGEKVFMRYSINAFNTQEDLDTLFGALEELKNAGKLL